jgi:hypothetical protein
MNEVVTWVAIIGAGGGGSIVTFITFWMALASRIDGAKAKAEAAEERAKNADLIASTAVAKCELLGREMNDSRIEAAAKIAALEAMAQATSRSLVQAETRLAKSIDDLGEKMDHLGDTIIRTLGELLGKRGQ